jgi:hypothetical protein
MAEPRLRPLNDAEASGTQALLIASAEHNGAPDPLCARIYVRAEAGRNWLRHWNELLNGGSLPVPLKEMCRVLISMKHGCGYCSTVRSRVAFENGLTEEKLMASVVMCPLSARKLSGEGLRGRLLHPRRQQLYRPLLDLDEGFLRHIGENQC